MTLSLEVPVFPYDISNEIEMEKGVYLLNYLLTLELETFTQSQFLIHPLVHSHSHSHSRSHIH